MRHRGPKPAKAKVQAKPPVARKSPKNKGSEDGGLEKRLAEALAQLTATSEILGVISSSPTKIQPVFDTILDNATRLCGAARGSLFLFDGEAFRAASMRGGTKESVEYHSGRAVRPGPHSALGRIIRERRPVHIHDLRDDPAYPEGDPLRKAVVDLEGMRTLVMVPLLKGERLVGAIGVHRREVRPFRENQIGLLKTFADQAVIAIENVRLFKELETRNRELTDALEQQAATSEILRAMSSSPTDIGRVLDGIAANAVRVCGASDALVFLREGDFMRRVSHHGPVELAAPEVVRLSRGRQSGAVILDRQVVHLVDAQAATEFPATQELAQAVGMRTALGVPLLREGEAIGSLIIRRKELQPFTNKQI